MFQVSQKDTDQKEKFHFSFFLLFLGGVKNQITEGILLQVDK